MAAFITPAFRNEYFPDLLGAVIVATNQGATAATLSYGACSFGLRLYPSSGIAIDPVWDNRTEVCDMPLFILTVPAHSTAARLVNVALQPSVLGDSLPGGRYRVAVTWRLSPSEPVRVIPAGSVWIGPTP